MFNGSNMFYSTFSHWWLCIFCFHVLQSYHKLQLTLLEHTKFGGFHSLFDMSPS